MEISFHLSALTVFRQGGKIIEYTQTEEELGNLASQRYAMEMIVFKKLVSGKVLQVGR